MIAETVFQSLFVFTAVAFVILWGGTLLSIGITSDGFYYVKFFVEGRFS